MPGGRYLLTKEDVMSEIGFLGDGSVVLVVGEAPARATSNDGGRTTEEVPQVLVARLAVEEVEADAVLDERPTYDPETATWIRQGDEPNATPATTPSGASDVAAVPARGEAQNADELQAEIDALQAKKAALAAGGTTAAGDNPISGSGAAAASDPGSSSPATEPPTPTGGNPATS